MNSDDKAKAWEWADCWLAQDFGQWQKFASPRDRDQARHILDVIVPSLRRRAAIIRRNAKKGRVRR